MNFNELYPKKKEYYYLLMSIKTTAECNVSNCVIDKQKAKLLMRYINNKENEIERLNNIINELERCIKDKYYEAVDYQTKIRQSDLMQGDYPVSYYLSEQDEQLCNYFLNRLKDLQELKGSGKE